MKLACFNRLLVPACVIAFIVLLALGKSSAAGVESAVIGDIRDKWFADDSQQQLPGQEQPKREPPTPEQQLLFPVEQFKSYTAARHHHHQHHPQQQHQHLHQHLHQHQHKHHVHGRTFRENHYKALELEQRQQQLGKHSHWLHAPAPATLPDYVNDEELAETHTPHSEQHVEQLDYVNSHFDLESYQRYANIELPLNMAPAGGPSTRSGRHRGRHVTPHNGNNHNSNHANNVMLPLISELGGKYLRSLPDSVDFLQDRLYATQPQRHWPVKREAIVEGDVILGGLMMVHSREDSITCGPIMPQGGIQALEAMLYTIDRINEMHLLPNITLGAHILDDCDKDSYGLEMAVDFIKGEVFFMV